jgi:hypothetical protein
MCCSIVKQYVKQVITTFTMTLVKVGMVCFVKKLCKRDSLLEIEVLEGEVDFDDTGGLHSRSEDVLGPIYKTFSVRNLRIFVIS